MIQFNETVCRNLDLASRREWLETNGIGGFASSTIAGLNTRRYHGLLVAASKPPLGRMVLLSKIEETLVIGGRRIELSTNRYPGVVHPQGYRYLKQFRRDPFPVFLYEAEGLELEKSLFMVYGENTTVIQYEIRGAVEKPCALELRPLIAFRDYHYTTHENAALDASLQTGPECVRIAPYPGLPTLTMSHSAGAVRPAGEWYRNFEYTVEQERGLDYREDLFNPLVLQIDLKQDRNVAIVVSTGSHSAAEADSLRRREVARRKAVASSIPSADPFIGQLAQAADQFIVRRGEETTIIAGYHWFTDWGRDAMIALPGLTLSTGRYDAARSILLAFAANVNQGMIPNRFPDGGESPEYNTVDATLWFFEAARAFDARTGDDSFILDRLYCAMADIIAWHERGTRHGIRVDADALLRAGEPGLQLTWMDSKVGDLVITPRHGKPVELQALWYNALRVMEEFAGRFGDCARRAHYRELADRARESFNRLFWNETAGCLYDVIGEQPADSSMRPNQIFAVSLFHTMLPAGRAARVVEAVERDLLTPYGLRTLAPGDPRYRGRYTGDPASRDSAYHQGTVWPWLLGPFLTAYLKVHGRSKESLDAVARRLQELRRYIGDEGVGQIPELFDGDAPHRPGGCIAQAWSVAELLRVACDMEG